MSCRTGPLRAVRSPRDVYTGFARPQLPARYPLHPRLHPIRMTQPGHLPRFLLTLRRDSDPHPFIATCLIDGKQEYTGFHTASRRFDSPEQITAALERAGVPPHHFKHALTTLLKNEQPTKSSTPEAAFEVSQNEGQLLGLLHIDSTE